MNNMCVKGHGRGKSLYAASEIGRKGEDLAARHLEEKGYRLVGRNVRSGPAEIDLIAITEDILCFVEGKGRLRQDQGEPEEFVDFRKQSRLVKGAICFHARERYRQFRIRFDVVSVLEDNGIMKINHIENAFEVDP